MSGEEHFSKYNSSENVTKHFCSICGSNLISTYADRADVIGIPLGGLGQAPINRPGVHIFVSSKAPWFEICDNFPQYEAWPCSEDKVRETM